METNDLCMRPNLGPKTLFDINEALRKYGLALKGLIPTSKPRRREGIYITKISLNERKKIENAIKGLLMIIVLGLILFRKSFWRRLIERLGKE